MTDLDPRVPKLEALLSRVRTRAAEPRPHLAEAQAVAQAQAAQAAPAAVKAAVAPPTAAAAPSPVPVETSPVPRPAPQPVAGPPSRRSHGALPAVTPPPRASSSAIPGPARDSDGDHKTPIPAPPPAPQQGSDAGLSSVHIDADSSVDALLARDEADYDDATIQATVAERPTATLAGVGIPTFPRSPSPSSRATPVPAAPASAPRAIEAPYEEEEERHLTPPPESGKQKTPSLAPVPAAASRRSPEAPRLADEMPESLNDRALAGVGGGVAAITAKAALTEGAATEAAKPTGPSVYTASLPRATVHAVVEGGATQEARAPRNVGDLLDGALSL